MISLKKKKKKEQVTNPSFKPGKVKFISLNQNQVLVGDRKQTVISCLKLLATRSHPPAPPRQSIFSFAANKQEVNVCSSKALCGMTG